MIEKDITTELQDIRQLVRQVIQTIGRPPRQRDAELSNPSRAVVQLRKFNEARELEQQISSIFSSAGLPEIPLNVLICTFEHAEPDAWKGTLFDFIAASRAGLDVLNSQTDQAIQFDKEVDERRRAQWAYEDQLRKVERLEQRLEELQDDSEGEEWKDVDTEFPDEDED